MKDSVKLTATKFQAWKRDNPDEGYWYDEIEDFTSSLSRGELLAVFEWLAQTVSPPTAEYRPEYIGGAIMGLDNKKIQERIKRLPPCPKCSDRGIVQDDHGRNSTCECHYK